MKTPTKNRKNIQINLDRRALKVTIWNSENVLAVGVGHFLLFRSGMLFRIVDVFFANGHHFICSRKPLNYIQMSVGQNSRFVRPCLLNSTLTVICFWILMFNRVKSIPDRHTQVGSMKTYVPKGSWGELLYFQEGCNVIYRHFCSLFHCHRSWALFFYDN